MRLRHVFAFAAVVLSFGLLRQLSAQDDAIQGRLETIRREVDRNSFVPIQGPNARNWVPNQVPGDAPLDAEDGEIIPARSFDPVAMPCVQLIRGAQILEISNNALYRSGLFDAAINASPVLSSQLRTIQSLELQLNQLTFYKKEAANQPLANAIQKDIEAVAQGLSQAQADFEHAVRQVGLNGAQVATVQSDGSARQQEYVLIQAVSSTPGDNLGYTMKRVRPNGQLGVTTVPSEYLLPTPVDANDVFFSDALGVQRLQDGLMLNITNDQKKNPIVRFNLMPRFGLFYDTSSAPSGGNFARGVSLAGTDDPAAGQTGFLQAGGDALTQLDLLLDAQILDVGSHTLQFFVDTNNDQNIDQLGVEHLGFRVYNRDRRSFFEGWALAIGQVHSLFSQVALRPDSIQANSTLIGTSDRTNNNLPQIAVQVPVVNNARWKIAVEDPYDGDLFVAPGANVASMLTRWPTFTTSLAWSNSHNSLLQFGGIVRSLGFQNTSGVEHFGTAWGLSATAKIGHESGGGLFFGVSGGDGVGDYIQGITHSAIASSSSLNTISGVGTFIGFQGIRRNVVGMKLAEVNVAYGYSWMETPGLLGPTVDQELQQGWVNYLRFFSDYVALGFEYQFGYRQIASGDSGEDHRFMAVIALKTGPAQQSTRISQSASSLSEEVRINGRPIHDVVRQNQCGGPAYAQSF